MATLGPANTERAPVGTQVGQCDSAQREALTALIIAKHSGEREVPEEKRRLPKVVVTNRPKSIPSCKPRIEC